jgi:hypothetical protein
LADKAYPIFDRSRLKLLPLEERNHALTLRDILPLDARVPPFAPPDLAALARRVLVARREKWPVILMIGATSESVADYIRQDQFGLWRETGLLHDVFRRGVRDGLGMGQAVGRAIEKGKFRHRDISLFAAGYRLRVPVTVHVGIGCDIIHEDPRCDGAVIGEASYRDFLIFARALERLEGGVFLNIGTAVMGPEVYLKALAMARNVARQRGRAIERFTTAVFDVQDAPADFRTAMPRHDRHLYYRPWKTILVRTVADGGRSYYFRGDHAVTIPNLYRLCLKKE